MPAKSIRDIYPGTAILDMHDAYRLPFDMKDKLWIKEPHRVVAKVQIPAPDGFEFITNAVRPQVTQQEMRTWRYTNKMLVVIDIDYEHNHIYLKCAWSYDDNYFGLATVAVERSA